MFLPCWQSSETYVWHVVTFNYQCTNRYRLVDHGQKISSYIDRVCNRFLGFFYHAILAHFHTWNIQMISSGVLIMCGNFPAITPIFFFFWNQQSNSKPLADCPKERTDHGNLKRFSGLDCGLESCLDCGILAKRSTCSNYDASGKYNDITAFFINISHTKTLYDFIFWHGVNLFSNGMNLRISRRSRQSSCTYVEHE